MDIRYSFPIRPLCPSIADCAGTEVQSAFINLNPYTIFDRETGKIIHVPALFISDGMSTPDILQGRYQADEGINAGHTHDYLYSRRAASDFFAFTPATATIEDDRKTADEIMGDYLHQHCPGYANSKADACELAVRIGGGKSFRDESRDEWRRGVAEQLMGGMAKRLNYGYGIEMDGLDYNKIITILTVRMK